MLLHIPLFNAVAAVGDFLLALRSKDAVLPSVCVICDVVTYNTIRVTWWLTLEELSVLNVEAPPLHFHFHHTATF